MTRGEVEKRAERRLRVEALLELPARLVDFPLIEERSSLIEESLRDRRALRRRGANRRHAAREDPRERPPSRTTPHRLNASMVHARSSRAVAIALLPRPPRPYDGKSRR